MVFLAKGEGFSPTSVRLAVGFWVSDKGGDTGYVNKETQFVSLFSELEVNPVCHLLFYYRGERTFLYLKP